MENQPKKIGGYTILYVGMIGAGKSSLVKHNLRNVHPDRIIVNDVQGEYFKDSPRYTIDEFQDEVALLRKCHAVFEEASAFFSNRGRDDKQIRLLVDQRHSEMVYHLCFHSIRSIPASIYDYVDFVYVLQTNDIEDVVKNRFPSLLNAWYIVNNTPDKADKFKLPNGKFTPYKLVKLRQQAKLL